MRAKTTEAADDEKRRRLAVGLMSGTSMDGVDAALVELRGPAQELRVRLIAFITLPYPWWLQKRLLGIAGGETTTAAELSRLNVLVGEAFGEAALRVCHRARISPSRLFVVGSHGQTIHHFGGLASANKGAVAGKESAFAVDVTRLPELQGTWSDTAVPDLRYVATPSTLQIGEPALIAEAIGAPVVGDFRVADMAAGGQGAPLVPMADYLLLRGPREGRVALNIGGIANITVIPAAASPEQVFGFDTGPGNMVIDALVRHFTRGRKSHDAGGRMAARGKIIEPLLAELLRLPLLDQQPPRSYGREQFGEVFVKEFFLKRRDARYEDLLRTATELTARTIADAIERFVLSRVEVHRLIISGGGARNRLLVTQLKRLLPDISVDFSDKYGLPVDAKEAIAFAVLADRTLHGLPGNLPSVTGARRAVVLGKLVRSR